jgi:hypothetical protein
MKRVLYHPQQQQQQQQQQLKSTLAWNANNSTMKATTTTTACHNSASSSRTRSLQQLSWLQIRSIMLSAAIPMVGFGFMDNFIMIQAGSMIDNTLGVQLGLATMTAAALGQVVSDTCGVLFGGTLERYLAIQPLPLTAAQRSLALVPRLRLAGAVLGVIVGCLMGAVVGLFLGAPSEREDENEKPHQRLERVMEDMMTSPEEKWQSKDASCALYINRNMDRNVIPKDDATISTTTNTAAVKALASSLQDGEVDASVAYQCAEEGRVTVLDNVIYIPVAFKNNTVLGVLRIEHRDASPFTSTDIEDAKRVARNIGLFMTHMME